MAEENLDVSEIPGLQDAKFAGTKGSEDCTLLLVEGPSASLFVKHGLKEAGLNDRFGYLYLDGYPPNISEHPWLARSNPIIRNIKSALGLHFDEKYRDVKKLRYGHLMLMTDQDPCGTAIKGLIINIFYKLWPELLRVKPPFFQMFITPVATAFTAGNKVDFYSVPEYNAWKREMGDISKEYTISYYKGLNSLPHTEAERYFRDMDGHRKQFVWIGTLDKKAIELAYSPKMKDEKKIWLFLEAGDDFATPTRIRYCDFFSKEWRRAIKDDVQRLIPSMVDGFKKGQRKAVYTILEKPDNEFDSISSFATSAIENTFYRHRPKCMEDTIIRMAEYGAGTNNVSFLDLVGQSGSRKEGRSHPVYPGIHISAITRFVFLKQDDPVLNYLNEGGKEVEPEYFVPIIPMVLANGCESIVNGVSTFIPKYDPRVLIANLKSLLKEDILKEELIPYYKHFKGKIKKMEVNDKGEESGYYSEGIIRQVQNSSLITICELPVRMTAEAYTKYLDRALKKGVIESFKNLGSASEIRFEIILTNDAQNESQETLLEMLNLISELGYDKMFLLDENNNLKHYHSPESILRAYIPVRQEFYKKRKSFALKELKKGMMQRQNIAMFINLIVGQTLSSIKKPSAEQLKALNIRSFTFIDTEATEVANLLVNNETEVLEGYQVGQFAAIQVGETDVHDDFGYLFKVPAEAFHADDDSFKKQLQMELADMICEFEMLAGTSSDSIWIQELDALLSQLHLTNMFERLHGLLKQLRHYCTQARQGN